MEDATIALHGGRDKQSTTRACALPIYQTSAYNFDNSKYAADLFEFKQEGNIYTRINNPTTDVLEKRVAMLEHGVGALAVSSGMSAILTAVLTILSAGDEIVSSSALYGGTHTLFSHTLKNLGITTKFIDTDNIEDYKNAITPKTKLIYCESIPNPKLNIIDIEELAKLAHENNIPLMIDNTVPSPYLFKPIDFGADIVVHSATKFLGGHGTSLAGIIVDSGNFDWEKSGKFKALVEPDVSYHGISYTEMFGKSAFIAKARAQILRDFGCVLSPFNAFMICQGIETLTLRMEKHSENALAVAKYLKNSEYVSWVNYPGLEDNKNHELAKKYFKKGFGAMIGFGIKGGVEAGVKFIDNVKLLSHLANIGDAKSLVIHPASTTHQQLSHDERIASGATDDFIRLSIGLEDINDIIADIEQALKIACK
ncbi:MAG: O-acetylhomoserine aminocarboxypropyltransferase/cysteine synthase [Cyanobacteria bacterium SIG30]|nr:O-acetylhomoserine aminocarboxypropyltransferase/cysteine synthase [Cyanobacteria bacterium SIG30]